jgi:hypothetical protein
MTAISFFMAPVPNGFIGFELDYQQKNTFWKTEPGLEDSIPMILILLLEILT